MGSTVPIIAKIGNFCYKVAPKGYIPLSDFYNFWCGEGVPGLHPESLMPNFTNVASKIWAYSPQNCQKW